MEQYMTTTASETISRRICCWDCDVLQDTQAMDGEVHACEHCGRQLAVDADSIKDAPVDDAAGGIRKMEN